MNSTIVPPPELVAQWADMLATHTDTEIFGAAAQWGADQELKECIRWLHRNLPGYDESYGERLRAARRPKPPSLKEQSLALIDLIQGNKKAWDISDLDVVRRALEQLDD